MQIGIKPDLRHPIHPASHNYIPAILDLAHQPDEWIGVRDMIDAALVMALPRRPGGAGRRAGVRPGRPP
ncbi:hypothetical protein [Jannaschia pohangensis]|uniref:hypothetical protein n=1 Tax=Jannaschia pohangensis TaxID=390807 RepID=UPI000B216315|nr:hypothetical protein [Jannaschia pohangensis]